MDGEDSNAEKSIIITETPSLSCYNKSQNPYTKNPAEQFRNSLKKDIIKTFKQNLAKFEDLDTRNISLRKVQNLIEGNKHKNYLEIYIKCLNEHKKSSSPGARKLEVFIFSYLSEIYKEALAGNINALKVIEKISFGVLKYFYDMNSDVQESAAEAFCSIFKYCLSEENQKKVFLFMFEELDKNFTTSDVNVQQTAALTIFKWANMIFEMKKREYLAELFTKMIPLFLSLRSEFFFLLSSLGFLLEKYGFEPIMGFMNRILYKINSYFNNPSGDKKLKLEACCLLLYIGNYLFEIRYKGLEDQIIDIIIKSLKKLKIENSRGLRETAVESLKVWKDYYKFLCEIYENPQEFDKIERFKSLSNVKNEGIGKTEKNYKINWGKEKKRFLKKGDGINFYNKKKEEVELGIKNEPKKTNEKPISKIFENKVQLGDFKTSKNHLNICRNSNDKFHLKPKSKTIKVQPVNNEIQKNPEIKNFNAKDLLNTNSVTTNRLTEIDEQKEKSFPNDGESKNLVPSKAENPEIYGKFVELPKKKETKTKETKTGETKTVETKKGETKNFPLEPEEKKDNSKIKHNKKNFIPDPIQTHALKARKFSITSNSPKELQIINNPKFSDRLDSRKNSDKSELPLNLLINNQHSFGVRPSLKNKHRNFSIDVNLDIEKAPCISVASTKASQLLKTPRSTFPFSAKVTPKNLFRSSNAEASNKLTILSIIQLKNQRILKLMDKKFEFINEKLDSTQARLLELNKILELKRIAFEQRNLKRFSSLNPITKKKQGFEFSNLPVPNNSKQIIPGNLTYYWSEIIGLVEKGQIAEGINKLLGLKDDLYLLRLMLNNKDFLKLIPQKLRKKLIRRLLNVLESRFFEKMSLNWIINANNLGLLKVIDKNTFRIFMERLEYYKEFEESI